MQDLHNNRHLILVLTFFLISAAALIGTGESEVIAFTSEYVFNEYTIRATGHFGGGTARYGVLPLVEVNDTDNLRLIPNFTEVSVIDTDGRSLPWEEAKPILTQALIRRIDKQDAPPWTLTDWILPVDKFIAVKTNSGHDFEVMQTDGAIEVAYREHVRRQIVSQNARAKLFEVAILRAIAMEESRRFAGLGENRTVFEKFLTFKPVEFYTGAVNPSLEFAELTDGIAESAIQLRIQEGTSATLANKGSLSKSMEKLIGTKVRTRYAKKTVGKIAKGAKPFAKAAKILKPLNVALDVIANVNDERERNRRLIALRNDLIVMQGLNDLLLFMHELGDADPAMIQGIEGAIDELAELSEWRWTTLTDAILEETPALLSLGTLMLAKFGVAGPWGIVGVAIYQIGEGFKSWTEWEQEVLTLSAFANLGNYLHKNNTDSRILKLTDGHLNNAIEDGYPARELIGFRARLAAEGSAWFYNIIWTDRWEDLFNAGEVGDSLGKVLGELWHKITTGRDPKKEAKILVAERIVAFDYTQKLYDLIPIYLNQLKNVYVPKPVPPSEEPTQTKPPDLVVESLRPKAITLASGESFTLSATVKNAGNGQADSTTLRYYLSSDTPVGDPQSVSALSPNGTSDESVTLKAPTTPGTYYYSACVDAVDYEDDTTNNCSTTISVTVEVPTVEVPTVEGPSVRAELAVPIYWTDYDTGKIQRINPGSSNIEDLVTGLRGPRSIALDVSNGKMYWTNNIWQIGDNKIQRSNLNGFYIEDLVTESRGPKPSVLALDVVGGKMYWIDQADQPRGGKIRRSNLNGRGVEDLVTIGAIEGGDIALDVVNGKMYWTELHEGKICRSNLNGKGMEDLFTGLSAPRGIALDISNRKMYWIDSGKIRRSNLDGSGGVEDLLTGLSGPNSIALDISNRKMYWTTSGKIQCSNLDGSSGVEDLVTGLDFPLGIALGIAGGSHESVVQPRNDYIGEHKIYWTSYEPSKIQRINPGSSNIEDLVTGLGLPRSIALDVVGGKMYWTDWGTDKIQRANLDGSGGVEDLLTGLGLPLGIALDVSGGKMYWTAYDAGKIQRANLDGSGDVEDLITTGLSAPGSIALDVSDGKMYWTDYGTDKIQRANLDGSGGIEDLVTGLDYPHDIALDVSDGKMYWTDYGTDKIQRANLDGSGGVEDLLTGLSAPGGIALDIVGGKMYWTAYDAGKIQRANLDGSGGVEDLLTGLGFPLGIALGIPSIPVRDKTQPDLVVEEDLTPPSLPEIGEPIRSLVTPTGSDQDQIRGLIFDADGDTIYSGNSHTIFSQDVDTGNVLRTFEHKIGFISRLFPFVFKNEIGVIQVGLSLPYNEYKQKNVPVLWKWNPNMENPPPPKISELEGAEYNLQVLAISADGSRVAGLSWVKEQLKQYLYLWSAGDGSYLGNLEFPDSSGVSPININSDGSIVALGDYKGMVHLYDTRTLKKLKTLKARGQTTLIFSPDDRTLASGYSDGTIHLWDTEAEDNNLLRTLKTGVKEVSSLAFNGDGSILASGLADGSVIVWDATTGERIRTLRGHLARVVHLAFSPADEGILASVNDKGEVLLWDYINSPEPPPLQAESQRHVHLIYFIPTDQDEDPNMLTKFDGLIRRVQHFYAQQMDSNGLGRKTFKFETDENGKAKVHVIRAKNDLAYYETPRSASKIKDSTASKIVNELSERSDVDVDKSSRKVYFVALETYAGHLDKEKLVISTSTTCGQRINRGLEGKNVSSGGLVVVPLEGRYSCANDFLSAAHELGHAFGLAHDFRNRDYIMSYGGNEHRLSKAAANWLDVSSFFNANLDGTNTKTQIKEKNHQERILKFEVTDADGIHQVRLLTESKKVPPGYSNSVDRYEKLDPYNRSTLTDWKPIAGSPAVTVEFKLDDALEGLGWKRNGAQWVHESDQSTLSNAKMKWQEVIGQEVTIQVIDENGNITENNFCLGSFLACLFAPPASTVGIPVETSLLPNYPNPFNPETWLPYQLAKPADVTLTIYDIQGRVLRRLDLGHQRAGIYHSRTRAAHWDGRNTHGESVASGVYFYTLTAGDFTATRKLLIRK
ncbi:hypothetical protein C6503_16655 [Candidatus Poribacteria bacterium]|nr:MAG: hypothetical protein C6503_16655 [Candidatus Poribacteria bacterium]